MTLTTQAATLRASLRRELVRLHATPRLGGPFHATREGVLLAFDDSGERCYVVTSSTITDLGHLKDCAGPDAVWALLELLEASDG